MAWAHRHRPRHRALLVLLMLAAAPSLSGCPWSPSPAEPPYTLLDSWGGPGTEPGRFRDPNGIAVADGRVYVADSRNHRIQVFTRAGEFLAQWPVPGEGRPMNLDVAAGRLYAADYWNDVIRVYRLDSGELVRSLGGPGSAPGRFRNPGGVAVAADGRLFVADTFNQRVQALRSDGTFVGQWGRTGEIGHFFGGRFNYPLDVAVATDGSLFVVDGFNDRVQVFDSAGEFRRKWGGPFAINLRGGRFGWFRTPTSIALGPSGQAVFVADQENNRVQKFTREGDFLTAFGTPHEGAGYTESAVAVAADGTVYTTNLVGNEVEVWRQPTPRQ